MLDNLPLDRNYSGWGGIITHLSRLVYLVKDLKYPNLKNKYFEVTDLGAGRSSVKAFTLDGLQLYQFIDSIVNHNEFTRLIGENTYHIKDNKVYFIYKSIKPKKYISKLPASKEVKFNHLVLDVETYTDKDGIMHLYAISVGSKNKYRSFYLTDYLNSDAMVQAMLEELFTRKNTSRILFIHNGSNFDLVFLLKHIVNFPNVKVSPVIREGSFINLEVRYGRNQVYKINIRDSLLFLPASLKELALQFNDTHLKDIFPYDFVNADNLNYEGPVPSYEYFNSSKVTLDDYNKYCERFKDSNWNLREEAIRYCEQDCKALFEVILNFGNKVFNDFKINIYQTPTLPSLAMRHFRTNHLTRDMKIPMLTGDVYDDLSKAFYGGHVDMYIPANDKGTEVYVNDVNALYPTAMRDNKYPTLLFAHFIGDISIMERYNGLLNDNLGVFKVRVHAPKDILHPLLPHKSNNVTVYGDGTWVGWYYSEELLNAAKYGYTYEILAGYLFEGQDIFKGYVNSLAQMKEQAQKGTPNYTIAKLLLNSLPGRFGMSDEQDQHYILDNSELEEFKDKVGIWNIQSNVDLEGKTLVSSRGITSFKTPKVNIAVALAVTANGRIFMSRVKNNPDIVLYYTDTDSAFTAQPLPSSWYDPAKMGYFKLENRLSCFVSTGAKIYAAITKSGLEYSKVRGFTGQLSCEDLRSLLDVDSSFDRIHKLCFKDKDSGYIYTSETGYGFKASDTKRNLRLNGSIVVGTFNKTFEE
uniref:DNA polymerase n=2 Tax=Porodaedalea mongolica TaxID=2651638 RepID=UPI0021AD42CC|nr:DNA polymerase [Porodaedalea mongolica]UUA03948.1 DNA polymerase [Porodaedalea mongolica]WCF76708.1 DNA polymerase [Porodaedalea mongolica]